MIIRNILIILFLLASFGCASAQDSKVYQPDSFIQIHTVITSKLCRSNEETKSTECMEAVFGSYGSGSIIKHIRNKSFILTAGHVCDVNVPDHIKRNMVNYKVEFFIRSHENKRYKAEIHKIADDHTNGGGNDLCLLKTSRLDAPALRLSSGPPKPGEKVFAMSAPLGVYYPPSVLFLSGHNSGPISTMNKHHALISIPAIGGSSGSSVLNSHGKVVGVIFAVNPNFRNITIMVKHKSLKDFLSAHLKL